MKECSSDDTLPDGFAVKKGDMVNYQPYAMGRMKFLWGDDADNFRPERWFNDEGVFQPENPFKFTAFQVSYHETKNQEFGNFFSFLSGCLYLFLAGRLVQESA